MERARVLSVTTSNAGALIWLPNVHCFQQKPHHVLLETPLIKRTEGNEGRFDRVMGKKIIKSS